MGKGDNEYFDHTSKIEMQFENYVVKNSIRVKKLYEKIA